MQNQTKKPQDLQSFPLVLTIQNLLVYLYLTTHQPPPYSPWYGRGLGLCLFLLGVAYFFIVGERYDSELSESVEKDSKDDEAAQ